MGHHDSNTKTYFNTTIKRLLLYFALLNVSFHEINSIFGFVTFITIVFQIISGIMLSFSLIPEPMLIPLVRDEEDAEDSYTDDFFWMHERGVDIIVMYSYIHLFRKLYLQTTGYEYEATWKSGTFSWLILQGVIFFGLTLCCTHLSEITLTIAANILHTFFFFYGKFYWWIFTDKQLNSDTIVRIAYLHYVSAFYLVYIGYIHSIDMHYDWKNNSTWDGVQVQLQWNEEVVKGELWFTLELLALWAVAILFLLRDPEALSYEIFTWGDIGFMTDVRFYGVAPHWYFRPFMSWLITCPHHKTGIFGLIFFFLIVFYQPIIHSGKELEDLHKRGSPFLTYYCGKNTVYISEYQNVENNLYTQLTCLLFMHACLYTTSFLPYGRFYNRIHGNFASLMSFMYVFSYLAFPFLRKPYTLEQIRLNISTKTTKLKTFFNRNNNKKK